MRPTYQVITASSPGELESKVNEQIFNKWKLQGGVSVAMIFWSREGKDSYQRSTEALYAQAMILR
jgi:hypothetical protein